MDRKPRDKTEEIIEADYVNAPARTVNKVSAPPEKVIEEASYVNAPACTVDKVAAPPDQRSLFFTRSFPLIAVCWLILLVIMGLRIYFDTQSHQSDESGLMAANRNLTNLINKLRLDNEKTMRDNDNLTVQLDNLTQNYNVLESKITNLTADVQNLTTRNKKLETQNQQLETQNQQLETQRDNLTEQIQDLETKWNKLNVSRAQWSIDAYCPKTTNVRQCTACQKGWLPRGSNCYAYHDAAPSDWKTWEEARQDCRGKGSELLVVQSQDEKDALNTYSWLSSGTAGYWFGLRAEGGRWKWIDGSNLTESYWTPQPPPPATDGQCVMSVQTNKWTSVSCADRKRWICIMKALSV